MLVCEVCNYIEADHIAQMVDKLSTDWFKQRLRDFLLLVNAFRWGYMTMTSILLFAASQDYSMIGCGITIYI